MISVVMPSLDDERYLVRSLSALVPAAAEGVVKDVVLVDAGSRDATVDIADAAGCTIIEKRGVMGARLAAGAEAARGAWLLFLRPQSVLAEGWEREAADFIEASIECDGGLRAAAFSLALEARGVEARLAETAMRIGGWAGLARADQGLLLSRRLYAEIGGHRPVARMEDVDILRRIGRRRFTLMASRVSVAVPRPPLMRRTADGVARLAFFATGLARGAR